MTTLAKARRLARLPLLTLLVLVLLAVQGPPARAGGVINSSFLAGVAIEGTDPVAYFTEGKPIEGSSDFEHEWMGATWRFASAENRDQFAADPEKYAPQYGGYCAWAVSQGYTAKIDPAAWKIVKDKLYLNYSKDAQAKWSTDIPGNIAKGNANWPKIRADLAGDPPVAAGRSRYVSLALWPPTRAASFFARALTFQSLEAPCPGGLVGG